MYIDPNSGGLLFQVLIVIFTRTGTIASYPVDIGGTDPYSFTYDPRPTGL